MIFAILTTRVNVFSLQILHKTPIHPPSNPLLINQLGFSTDDNCFKAGINKVGENLFRFFIPQRLKRFNLQVATNPFHPAPMLLEKDIAKDHPLYTLGKQTFHRLFKLLLISIPGGRFLQKRDADSLAL